MTRVSFLATTNMLSVGVDVPRLGLMLVNGQPKTTSEYIQATSRVGRSRSRAVVTLYSATRPATVRTTSRSLRTTRRSTSGSKPTSVTPWSLPSRERALHAALVILVRHGVGLAANDQAGDFDPVRPGGRPDVIEHAGRSGRRGRSGRGRGRRPDTSTDSWRVGRTRVECLCEVDAEAVLPRHTTKRSRSLLQDFGGRAGNGSWETLHSMRNVDRQCCISSISVRTKGDHDAETGTSGSRRRWLPSASEPIYDIVGESLVACESGGGVTRNDVCDLRASSGSSGSRGFRSAPSHASLFGGSAPPVPYYRFPQWVVLSSVSSNDALAGATWRSAGEPPRCQMESARVMPQLVPMRFLMMCEAAPRRRAVAVLDTHRREVENAEAVSLQRSWLQPVRDARQRGWLLQVGVQHLRAIPLASQDQLDRQSASYRVVAADVSLWQRLEAARSPAGKHPQVSNGCVERLLPLVRSAIDIPPESELLDLQRLAVDVINTPEFEIIRSAPTGPLSEMLAQQLADQFGTSVPKVMAVVRAHVVAEAGAASQDVEDVADLAADEWLAFQQTRERRTIATGSSRARSGFCTIPLTSRPQCRLWHGSWTARCVRHRGSAQVRALVSFSRYRPDCRQLPPDLGRQLDWLPGIEVFGEGIFLSLDEASVARGRPTTWCATVASELERRRQASLFGPRLGAEASPRFLLLHTLAHVLIRQLAFECGYAASSLRERIYARAAEGGRRTTGRASHLHGRWRRRGNARWARATGRTAAPRANAPTRARSAPRGAHRTLCAGRAPARASVP